MTNFQMNNQCVDPFRQSDLYSYSPSTVLSLREKKEQAKKQRCAKVNPDSVMFGNNKFTCSTFEIAHKKRAYLCQLTLPGRNSQAQTCRQALSVEK